MIAIIDYGMGNLRSVSKAFEAVGHRAVVTRNTRVIDDASRVVLPGVGAFGDCMANLERYGLVQSIRKSVQSGKPFLGICLGLQLLFTESEEFGRHEGLGIIPGRVRRFAAGPAVKVPHMGWNQVTLRPIVPCSMELGTGPIGILSIHILSNRWIRRSSQRRRHMGSLLRRASGETMWWHASFTRRRANPSGCV